MNTIVILILALMIFNFTIRGVVPVFLLLIKGKKEVKKVIDGKMSFGLWLWDKFEMLLYIVACVYAIIKLL